MRRLAGLGWCLRYKGSRSAASAAIDVETVCVYTRLCVCVSALWTVMVMVG